MIELKTLVEAGVHFGHQKTKWCPKMKPFIWGHRKGIHIIDVSKTANALTKAGKFLESLAESNKQILWVGTKPAAKEIVQAAAVGLNDPYISNRWVGGMLTNYSQVKKSVTKFLHYQDILTRAAEFPYTKKELNIIQKSVERLRSTIGGIVKLSWPVGAIVVIDVKREATAIKEAMQAGIPVVALVDTNCDPSGIQYIIPGNDDSPKSIKVIVDYLAQSIAEGKKRSKVDESAAEVAVVEPIIDIVEAIALADDIEDVDAEGTKRTPRAKKAVSVEEAPKVKKAPRKAAPKAK